MEDALHPESRLCISDWHKAACAGQNMNHGKGMVDYDFT
jgi:hypothetical protein